MLAKIIAALIIFLSISSLDLKSSDDLRQAWNAFKINDFKNAKQLFTKVASAAEPDKLEALLALTLIADFEGESEAALKNFSLFYKSNPEPNPYLMALWSSRAIMSYSNDDYRKMSDFLQDIIESNKTNGMIKTMAHDFLSSAYIEKGSYSDAEKEVLKTGSIRKWSAVGTFENISSSGFNKNYLPIIHPEPEFNFKNKYNADVKWFDLPENNSHGWTFLWNFFTVTNSIVYVQTFCESSVETEAELRVGTSGSLRAWFNDQELISEPEERNNGLDCYIGTIKIHKGFNRILLQLGSSEIQNMNFLARICNSDGINISGLKFSTVISQYQKEMNFATKMIPNFAEKWFEDKLKANPDDLLNNILLSKLYALNDKSKEARKIGKQILKIAPNSIFALDNQMQLYNRSNNKTKTSLLLESIKQQAPESLISLTSKFEEEMKKENYEEAQAILDKVEKFESTRNNRILFLNLKIQLIAALKKFEELYKYINLAYNESPNQYTFVNYKLILEKDIKKNIDGAVTVLKKYVKSHNNLTIRAKLAALMIEKQDLGAYFDLMQELIDDEPLRVDYISEMAGKYFDAGSYDKAIKNYLKCIQIAPYEAFYYQELGDCYKEKANYDLARSYYQKSIKYNPFSFNTRNKLRRLDNKKPLFDIFPEPDWSRLFKDAPNETDYPSENSIILYDDTRRIVYSGGAMEEKVYLMVKVLTNQGRDDFKEYSVNVFRNQELIIEKAEVYKKDGSKLKAEVNDNDIVFTNLGVGDAILIIYKIHTFHFGSLSYYFWDKQHFTLFIPSLRQRYSVIAANDMKFDYKLSNSNMKPEIKEIDDFTVYTWETQKKDGVKPESYMPPIVDFGEMLDISSIPNWDFVSKWYVDLTETKMKSDPDIKDLINELFPDDKRAGLSQLDIIHKIYNYIVENIRYSSVSFRQSAIIPQKASSVISTQIGDCKDVSTLFVTLCREMGVKANLVLVSTRFNGRNLMPLPSIDFNHCIAEAEVQGKKYYIELTSDLNPFAAISSGLKNAFVLEIKKDEVCKPFYLDPKDRKLNFITRQAKISFNINQMSAEVKTKRFGGATTSTRAYYKDKSPEERRKNMTESIAKDFAKSKLINLSFDDNLKNTADSLSYIYSYTVDDVFQKITDLQTMRLPLTDDIRSFDAIATDNRKLPIDVGRYDQSDYTEENIQVQIPEGKELAELPVNVDIDCEHGLYNLHFELKDRILNIYRKFAFKKDYVPSSEFQELKKFVENVIKSDGNQLAFRDKKPEAAPKKKGKK
ncbi:MAG: DUF3857 domain-containing protein [Candidatus Kapabacteria bacterium]|nr:DUF3857 domain-containing protein [Candidatus Kapabacteria bacterium]